MKQNLKQIGHCIKNLSFTADTAFKLAIKTKNLAALDKNLMQGY